jgi:hypothetical protein
VILEEESVVLLEVMIPLADIVVKSALPGVVLPIEDGLANVLPFKKEQLRLATTVEDVTVNGLVPVETVDIKLLAVTEFPTNKFFPIPIPPKVVKLPPLLKEIASVEQLIPSPPEITKLPVILLVLGVVFDNDKIPDSIKFVTFGFQYEYDILCLLQLKKTSSSIFLNTYWKLYRLCFILESYFVSYLNHILIHTRIIFFLFHT